jgi:flagellin
VAFSINTNVASLQAQNYLRTSSNFQNQTIDEVTSGLRIVTSGDDAAGLAIANSYRSTEAVLTQGIQNANNGLSQLQIIDGGMNNISQLLDRASTLATESATGTFTGDRNVLNSEFQSVISEISRQAQSIGLNTGGTFARAMSVFIGGGQGPTGAAAIQNGSISVDLSQSTVDARSLGLQGVQASGEAGTDIGTGSADTSVAQILASNTSSPGNVSNFYINGPGFSGANKIDVQVNLSAVTDSQTLVAAINDAIQNAGNAVSPAATAFKNANITAAVNTDSQGRQQLTFSSSSTAFQVAAGDQTANALMGNFGSQAVLTGTDTSNSYTTSGPTDDYLTLSFNGGPAMDFSIGVVNGASAATVAGDLNAISAFNANAIATTDPTTHQLIITSANDAANSTIAVTSTTLSQDLGLSGTATANPAIGKSMAQTLTVSPNGNGGAATLAGTIVRFSGGGLASPVDITLSASATDYANAQTDLVSQVNANTALQAAGISVVAGANSLTFSSNVGQDFSVSTSGDVNNEVGLGSYQQSGAGSGNTFDYSTITGGNITTGGATDTLEISIAGGAAQQIQVTGAAADTAGALADLIDQQIATNPILAAAGLTASGGGAQGPITITSTNGTYFRLAEGNNNAANQILGFGAGTTANTLTASGDAGMKTSTPTSQTNDFYFNAGGSSASTVFPFTPIQDGSATQTVTIAANDSSGGAHSLAVVLSNNATSRDGESLDEAIAAVNAQLQQSNDPTLQGIVAVKNQIVSSTGVVTGEGIQFISALPSFTVTLSAAGTPAAPGVPGVPVGVGTSAEQGTVQNSQVLAGGGTADISNQSSAESAVTALANAVVALGAAQAVVGRSENQFTYAVNLAQSQLTNFAAAESSIRDADMAAAAANLTKAQILVQAGVAALAQANSAPEQVLTLLKQ